MMAKATSILGSQSYLYSESKEENGLILDNPEAGTLEFYPAGYTKASGRDNCNRQNTHEFIYSIAVGLGTENSLQPFPNDGYEILLLQDTSNPYDSNAIHCILHVIDKKHPLWYRDGRDLGFIPKKINGILLKNMQLINGVRISSVRMNMHDKYYNSRLTIAYGHNSFNGPKDDTSRFLNMMDE